MLWIKSDATDTSKDLWTSVSSQAKPAALPADFDQHWADRMRIIDEEEVRQSPVSMCEGVYEGAAPSHVGIIPQETPSLCPYATTDPYSRCGLHTCDMA